jgi:hypothetical protein
MFIPTTFAFAKVLAGTLVSGLLQKAGSCQEDFHDASDDGTGG